MRSFPILVAAALISIPASPAAAKDHVVRMLNKGSAGTMVYEPAFLKIAPGDTVRFVATDKSHNAESILGMLPAGASPIKGKMNQDVSVKFTQPGLYGIKCLPHYGLGLIALIQVGKPGNLAQAKAVKHPPVAQRRFNPLFASVK